MRYSENVPTPVRNILNTRLRYKGEFILASHKQTVHPKLHYQVQHIVHCCSHFSDVACLLSVQMFEENSCHKVHNIVCQDYAYLRQLVILLLKKMDCLCPWCLSPCVATPHIPLQLACSRNVFNFNEITTWQGIPFDVFRIEFFGSFVIMWVTSSKRNCSTLAE